MIVVLEYCLDSEHSYLKFERVAFVTESKETASKYFEDNHNMYLGCDRWLKVKIVDVDFK